MSYYLIWFIWFCLRTREFSHKRTHGLQLWQSPVYLLLCFHTKNRDICVSPTNSLLRYHSFNTCRFHWCSLEHKDSLWHPGQDNSPLLPHSHISDILHTQLWKQGTSGTDQPLKSSKDFFFLTSLAPSKVFLNEGELNNFSQKVFLIYYILQLDRPHPRPAGFTWTHQRFCMSKHSGECLHTPPGTLQGFRLHNAYCFNFIKEVLLLTGLSSCPLLSLWKWTPQKYTSTVLSPGSWAACPKSSGKCSLRWHLHPAELVWCVFHQKNTWPARKIPLMASEWIITRL